MDSTTFRILDTLSRDPGRRQSINGLVREIKELGYSAYYKNIYNKIQKLKEEGLLLVKKTGNISLVSLNLTSLQLIDQLMIMELEKKKQILQEYPQEEEFIRGLESIHEGGLLSTALIRPQRNIKLNAAEVLYLTVNEEAESLLTHSKKLARRHNKAVYPLILREQEFQEMLQTREKNQVKELLKDKTVLVNPTLFWKTVSRTRPQEAEEGELDPGKIGVERLYYNLSRFGYTAFTTRPQEKTGETNIETLVMACLLAGDARLAEAVAVLLAKNRVNYRLLLYLALKHHKLSMMGYLIETTSELIRDKERRDELNEALKLFRVYHEMPAKVSSKNPTARRWGVKTKTTRKDFKEKMRLYNAV